MRDISDPGAGAAAPVSASASAIRLQGLEAAYDPARPVLRGVDLEIPAGQRVALIGANGSGKSTLLKCLIGLQPLAGGTAETLGARFTRLPDPAQRHGLRQRTGFVFQKHCLVRRRSVLSNVIHGMMGARGSWRAFSHTIAPADWRRRAMAALDDVRLADHAMARADRLSGGQQQRVAIARALVRSPALVIADEPAASLDPVAGREVMALFSGLSQAQGITLLFTSHDMEHAAAYADRIIGLRDGVVCLDRPADGFSGADLKGLFDG